MPAPAHERPRLERTPIVVGIDNDGDAGRQRLVRQRRKRHEPRGRNVHLLELFRRPDVPHAQRGVAAQNALGEIGRGDVVNRHGRRGARRAPVPRRGREAQQPGDDGQGGMQASHVRPRSMRVASAKPAIAASVTTATPAPRETPASSVIVTAPIGVLA